MAPNGTDPCEARTNAVGAKRILVVEDEFLVAALLEDDLNAAGYAVVGPFTSLASATQAARGGRLDLAILDVNLNGEMVYPLADELLARKVPFIFLSGYGLQDMPEKYRGAPRIAKPYDPPALIREVSRIVPQEHR